MLSSLFSNFSHAQWNTLTFWALTPALLALPLVFSQTVLTIHLLSSFVVLPAYKKCRDYFWNKCLISPKRAVFALIHRTGRANLFTNLYNCFLTFVQAFNSGFTATLNGAITLSSSVKALFFFCILTLLWNRQNMVQASPREYITPFCSCISLWWRELTVSSSYASD